MLQPGFAKLDFLLIRVCDLHAAELEIEFFRESQVEFAGRYDGCLLCWARSFQVRVSQGLAGGRGRQDQCDGSDAGEF
uniref:Uncharacterized protein n=1 Tax=Rhizobium leguminosarum TaxID=384 RepID=A0A179BWK6_RHILE|nr:hypothetical protein A4U53_17280 [Rhizobium leguminosarum]